MTGPSTYTTSPSTESFSSQTDLPLNVGDSLESDLSFYQQISDIAEQVLRAQNALNIQDSQYNPHYLSFDTTESQKKETPNTFTILQDDLSFEHNPENPLELLARESFPVPEEGDASFIPSLLSGGAAPVTINPQDPLLLESNSEDPTTPSPSSRDRFKEDLASFDAQQTLQPPNINQTSDSRFPPASDEFPELDKEDWERLTPKRKIDLLQIPKVTTGSKQKSSLTPQEKTSPTSNAPLSKPSKASRSKRKYSKSQEKASPTSDTPLSKPSKASRPKRKYSKSQGENRIWSDKEKKKLRELVPKYKDKSGIPQWKKIAVYFPKKTRHQCFSQAKSMKLYEVAKHVPHVHWKKEEIDLMTTILREQRSGTTKASLKIPPRNYEIWETISEEIEKKYKAEALSESLLQKGKEYPVY